VAKLPDVIEELGSGCEGLAAAGALVLFEVLGCYVRLAWVQLRWSGRKCRRLVGMCNKLLTEAPAASASAAA
jgi:hypothetical protein